MGIKNMALRRRRMAMKRILALAMVLVMLATAMGVGWAEESDTDITQQYQTEFDRPTGSNHLTMFLYRCAYLTSFFPDSEPLNASQIDFKASPGCIVFGAAYKNGDSWDLITLPRDGQLETLAYSIVLLTEDEGDTDLLAHKGTTMCTLYALLESDDLDDEAFLAWCKENADEDYARILNSSEENPLLWGDFEVTSKVNYDDWISVYAVRND